MTLSLAENSISFHVLGNAVLGPNVSKSSLWGSDCGPLNIFSGLASRQWVGQYFVQVIRGNGTRTVIFISIIFSRQKFAHRRFLRKSVQNGPSIVTYDFLLCHSRKNGNRSRRFPAGFPPFSLRSRD